MLLILGSKVSQSRHTLGSHQHPMGIADIAVVKTTTSLFLLLLLLL